LIVISPYYTNRTNDRTPESLARNYGNRGSLASWMKAKTDINLKEIRAGQEHVKEEM
jgi:hypothetical protein